MLSNVMSESIANKYLSTFNWVNNPAGETPIDEQLLERSGISADQVRSDFQALLSEVSALSARGNGRQLLAARINHVEHYIAGTLRESTAGPLVGVANTFADAQFVDDVDLEQRSDAFWNSHVLTSLIQEVLPASLTRAGHRVGRVRATYDAAGGEITFEIVFAKDGQATLTCGILHKLLPTDAAPEWLGQLAANDAELALAGAIDNPAAAEPAMPDPEIEPGEFALLIAGQLSDGRGAISVHPELIATALTRQELATAVGRPIAALEVTYADDNGALMVWEPGDVTPTTIALAA